MKKKALLILLILNILPISQTSISADTNTVNVDNLKQIEILQKDNGVKQTDFELNKNSTLKMVLTGIVSLVTVFFGAFFAFSFNNKLLKKQKELENYNYLNYAIVYLNCMIDNLLDIKSILKNREKEINILKIKIERKDDVDKGEVKESYKGFLIDKISLSIDIEKMNFLNNINSNLIVFLFGLKFSLEGLNSSLNDLNSFNISLFNGNKSLHLSVNGSKIPLLNLSEVRKTVSLNENLNVSLDRTIYIAKKTAEHLIKFAQIKYPKSEIANLVIDKEKQHLIPPKIEKWENLIIWDSKANV